MIITKEDESVGVRPVINQAGQKGMGRAGSEPGLVLLERKITLHDVGQLESIIGPFGV